MPSGITGATITTLTNGTTASAADVMASLNSLKNNGVNNDGGTIVTDNAGGLTAVKISSASGQLRGMFFTTPFAHSSNGTLNSGSTATFTAWGAGGVPSGALAILVNAFFTPAAAGAFAAFTPHGTAWSNGNYPAVGTSFNSTNICMGSFILPLDNAGKFDVKQNVANAVGFYIQQYGYIF